MFPLSQRRKCPSVVRGLLHMLTIHIIWTWDQSSSISSRRLSLLKHVLFDNRIGKVIGLVLGRDTGNDPPWRWSQSEFWARYYFRPRAALSNISKLHRKAFQPSALRCFSVSLSQSHTKWFLSHSKPCIRSSHSLLLLRFSLCPTSPSLVVAPHFHLPPRTRRKL